MDWRGTIALCYQVERRTGQKPDQGSDGGQARGRSALQKIPPFNQQVTEIFEAADGT